VSLFEEPDAGKLHVRFCEGPEATDVWLKYGGTAGKPSGNGENKPQPVAWGETGLLDSLSHFISNKSRRY
jgi:hypothetical protein